MGLEQKVLLHELINFHVTVPFVSCCVNKTYKERRYPWKCSKQINEGFVKDV